MKLRRGCGCPLLILLVANGFFVVASMIRLVTGPSDQPVEVEATRLGSGISLELFAANLVVCGLLTMAALRGQSLNESATGTSEGEDSSAEGADAEDTQDHEEV